MHPSPPESPRKALSLTTQPDARRDQEGEGATPTPPPPDSPGEACPGPTGLGAKPLPETGTDRRALQRTGTTNLEARPAASQVGGIRVINETQAVRSGPSILHHRRECWCPPIILSLESPPMSSSAEHRLPSTVQQGPRWMVSSVAQAKGVGSQGQRRATRQASHHGRRGGAPEQAPPGGHHGRDSHPLRQPGPHFGHHPQTVCVCVFAKYPPHTEDPMAVWLHTFAPCTFRSTAPAPRGRPHISPSIGPPGIPSGP